MLLHSVDCPEKLCPDCAQGLSGRIVPKDCAQAGRTIIVVSSSARVSEQSLEKLYLSVVDVMKSLADNNPKPWNLEMSPSRLKLIKKIY